jgi:hypothetical protein
MPRGGKKKYELGRREALEKWAKGHDKVMIWLSKLQRKSDSAWFLWIYCNEVRKTPEELLALKDNPQSKDAEYLLDKFVAESKLPHSIKVNVVINAKSFFAHNYRELARKSGQIQFIKQAPYRKHTKEELLKIYRSTQNPRDRALITFVWSTAIARESIMKVQWLHLEPDWEKQEIPHVSLPPELIKGHGRGKYAGVRQETFLTPEAKKDLLDYKEWLERIKGIKPKPEDTIFIELHPPYQGVQYGTLTKISRAISKRSVEFSWHDARRYVETALEEIKIHPNWARKIRGRKVRGEESPYSRPAIEQLRSAYKEAVPLLEFTQPTQLIQIQRRQEIVEEITSKMMSGEPLTQADRENVTHYGIKLTLKKPLKEVPFIHPKRRRRHRTAHNGGCENGINCAERFEQIKETDILSYLQQGWTIIHRLSDGQVIVKR